MNIILLGVVNVVVFGIAAERLNLYDERSSSLLENISFVRVSPLGHVCLIVGVSKPYD